MQWKRTDLQLGLEEELLGALRAVVDLVLLPVHGEDVLLQLVGLHKDCTQTRPSGRACGHAPHHSHVGVSPRGHSWPPNGLLGSRLAPAQGALSPGS